jgi:hypothetical protein
MGVRHGDPDNRTDKVASTTPTTRSNNMGACGCGYTTDEQKQCNGSHRVVQAVKADLAKALADMGHTEASELVKQYKKQS